MSSNNSLEETMIESKDGDIPFILCTPTKNDDDKVDVLASSDAEASPRQHTPNFFLKPRRSCKCTLGCHHEQKNMSTATTLDDGDGDLLERNSSSSSSPVPTLQSFDVMITPPVINLLKRRRPSHSQEGKQEGKHEGTQEGNDDGDGNASSKMMPLFPSLGRGLQQQSQRQQPPALRRPVARRPRGPLFP